MKTKVGLVVASLLFMLQSEPSQCEKTNAKRPINVTISKLAAHPRKYDGRLVRVEAVLVFGWEGDNFLVDPSKPPGNMPSQEDPASVWFYWKPESEQQVFAAIGQRRLLYGSFEGYFHFVERPKMVSVFNPGSLQFDAIASSVPDPQPQSFAMASFQGDVDEIRRILRSNPSLKHRYKNILLFLAVNTDRDDFVQELLSAGADTRFTGPGGDTSLMNAAWNCKLQVAKTLLAHGAPVNAANIKGETALMFAAQTCGNGQMVKALLEAGADPNAKMEDGLAPLLWARGNPANIELLLKAGADPTVRNHHGDTPESDNCDRGAAAYAQACSLIREALKTARDRSSK